MRKEDLLEGFGALDDDLLMRIENGSKTIMIWKAVKYGVMAACLMAILGTAYMFGINRPTPINNPISDPLQGSPIEGIEAPEKQEGADSNGQPGGKVEDLNSGAVKEGAISDHLNEVEGGSEVQNNLEDVPADGKGEYVEVNNDILEKDVSDFYGGSYLDTNGRFTIVLTIILVIILVIISVIV